MNDNKISKIDDILFTLMLYFKKYEVSSLVSQHSIDLDVPQICLIIKLDVKITSLER